MKYFLLFIITILTISLSYGQQKPTMSSKTPDQKADEIVAKVNETVQLSDEQIPKVKAISLDRVNENTAAFKKIGPNDKARLTAANKMTLDKWEAKLKEILTEEQFTKYMSGK